MNKAAIVGIDLGTSGVRAAAIANDGRALGLGAHRFSAPQEASDPAQWRQGVEHSLAQLGGDVDLSAVRGVAVDGTSGTVLALDKAGAPIEAAAMYNAPVSSPDILASIAHHAPPSSPARGGSSPLGKAIDLYRRLAPTHIVHQADWVAMQLGDGIAYSDDNNALKTGYDLDSRTWPAWIERAGLPVQLLADVRAAGSPVAVIGAWGRSLGLPKDCRVHVGTTDGCASFLATGAAEIGDGVTALGSSLVIKLLSAKRIEAPEFGIYSHRVDSMWLAGGASNTGGAVIKALLPDANFDALSARIDPEKSSGLSYYPLAKPGERFPVSDPDFAPRLSPRPDDDALYFQAILEGIADIEARGYDMLEALGGPALKSIRTVGGGAANEAWERIRGKRLGVPFLPALSLEAAVGVARLALRNVHHV